MLAKRCGDGEPEFHTAVPSSIHQLVNHLGLAPYCLYSIKKEWLQNPLLSGVTVHGDSVTLALDVSGRLSGQYVLMCALGLRSSLPCVGVVLGTQRGFSVRSVLIWDLAWVAFPIWEWLDPAVDVVLLARELWKICLVGDEEEDSSEQQDSWVKFYLWMFRCWNCF